jgi:long-chain acyl-CoA synthetase
VSERPSTVAAMFASTVERVGGRLAVVDGSERRTWDELAGDVRQLAGTLRARGITPGDGVAIVLGNDRAFVTTFLAVQVLGAMAVPLNPLFNAEELGRHLAGCGSAGCAVAGIVAEPDLVPVLRGGLAAAGARHQPWVEDFAALESAEAHTTAFDGVTVDPAAPALFAFSSGSTGTPKGMIRTNRNLAAEADQFAATVDVTEDDVILAVVALFHAHGLGNALLAAIRSGAALVLGRFERDATLAAIKQERVTLFPAVPFIFHSIAETRRAARADLQTLRLCFSAGAPLSQATFDLFHDRFGHPIRQLYGCSEAGSVTINLDDDASGTWDSVGRPMRGIEVVVIGDGGVRHTRRATGEIAFRSHALTAGYMGEGETTNAVFDDGWFRTGDLGRLDDAGNLFVTGRTKLFISTSGFKVDPFEVETVLRAQPGVADVVVVGAPGDRGEEIVKAVVVPDHADPDESRLRQQLVAACREQLAPFKVPRIVEFRDEIPRSPLGKILRKYLV